MRYCYIIEAENGVVKIGCSINPVSRLAIVRTNSPVAVRLLAMWPGCLKDEHKLHKTFGEYRTAFEWFELRGGVADFVEGLRGKNVSFIPEWEDCKHRKGDTVRAAALRSKALKERWASPGYRESRLEQNARYRAAKRRRADSLSGSAA